MDRGGLLSTVKRSITTNYNFNINNKLQRIANEFINVIINLFEVLWIK